MKRITKKICVIFLFVILVATIGEISLVHASISTAQEKALTFIENVLPIDITQYNITLSSYGVPKLPDIGAYKQNDANAEIITYSLESKDSSINVICTLNDGVLYMCQADTQKGSIITDKMYANTADAAKSFLGRYQAFSKLDSTEMLAMLANVDPTKNITITSGDLKLTITHKDLTGTAFGDSINFRWVRTINGCEYLLINAVFRDGAFSSFIDHRARYTIGDTTVNISKEQAIEIAMKYIKGYSYRISDDLVVSDFNVTEDRTIANLVPTVKEGNVLYPYWSVILYLNQTYPGSVTSLLLGIWADTGEVFFCNYQAYGGAEVPPTDSGSENSNTISDSNSNLFPITEPSPSSAETNEVSIDLSMVGVIAVATITIAAATIALIVKKRSK
jgi:hypothetical protein